MKKVQLILFWVKYEEIRYVLAWRIPGLFLFIFGLFKLTKNTIYATNQCEKCSSGAWIRTHDLLNTSRLP